MEYYTTIGIDVSDRKSQVCVMTRTGGIPRIVLEKTIPTTKEGLAEFLATQDKSTPVTFETGTHCRWMSEVASGAGHKGPAPFASIGVDKTGRGTTRTLRGRVAKSVCLPASDWADTERECLPGQKTA